MKTIIYTTPELTFNTRDNKVSTILVSGYNIHTIEEVLDEHGDLVKLIIPLQFTLESNSIITSFSLFRKDSSNNEVLVKIVKCNLSTVGKLIKFNMEDETSNLKNRRSL